MDLAFAALLLAAFIVPVVLAARRRTELFAVRAGPERLVHVRGRAPRQLLADWSDVFRRERLSDVDVRVVLRDGEPRLLSSPQLSESVQQQLRNVLGRYQLAELRAGAPAPKRSAG